LSAQAAAALSTQAVAATLCETVNMSIHQTWASADSFLSGMILWPRLLLLLLLISLPSTT
jgi:hypothetical protein